MSEKWAKRLVAAFGLGLVLAVVFGNSSLGFAVGFGVIFGGAAME